MSSEMDGGETESYLETRLTELDDFFHMDGNILTFRFLSATRRLMVKQVIKTNDLKFSHIEFVLQGSQIKKKMSQKQLELVFRTKETHEGRFCTLYMTDEAGKSGQDYQGESTV